MSGKSYSFQVGRFACTALLDGASVIGQAGILKRYPDATEADYRQAYADVGQSLDDADSSLNVLAVKIGDATVLVDSGEGHTPRGGHVSESMSLAGIAPEDVTLVVITHAHGDHVQGLLSTDGEPVYPNASYVISKTEMAIWEGRIVDGAAAAQRPIVSMMQDKGLRLIEMDEQIMPGLTAVPIPGHTLGQIACLFESDGEKMIHLADLLHTPMQFAHPEWSPSFDADTSLSVPTRRNSLGRAADENLLAMFYHLSFPGVGRVKRAGEGLIWQPIVLS
ncbi:MAG: MBL fold metallo-hydrolase [Chloroflexota bacterium]|nr:MBL fold metallo-hydrolase [Chloroflexota bacterium]